MISKVQIETRTPAEDGTGETIIKTREIFIPEGEIGGVIGVADRLRAANVADVRLIEPLVEVETGNAQTVEKAIDEAMRKRYGTGAANLAEIETRELTRTVINQGKTLQTLAETLALLTRAIMGGDQAAAEAAQAKIGAVPVLRANAGSTRPDGLHLRSGDDLASTDRSRNVVPPAARTVPEVEQRAAELEDADEIDASEPPEVAAARALIASVDGGRARGSSRDVRLPIDTSTAPPTLIQRGPDGKLVPQVPVIRADGSNSERLGDNAAANVQSQGWGVAGKRASSAIETFDPDQGKFVAGQLPIVGDSLRPPRSDIE